MDKKIGHNSTWFVKILGAALLALIMLAVSCCSRPEGPAATGRPETTVDGGNTDATPAEEQTAEPPATQVPLETTEYSFRDNADRFKIYGRYDTVNAGVTCDWSAGGFSVNAYCRGDVILNAQNSAGSTFFTVFIDGEQLEAPVLASKKTVIASGLGEGLHTIEVFRQTEVRQGRLVLKSLTLDGILLDPPAASPLNLIFIGDSISSGFGLNPKTVSGAEDHVDATRAYPFLTARALGADFEIIAVIGIGLVKGYVTETMGQVFPYIDSYRSVKNKYAAARGADAVIINLGTNDATMSSNAAAFKTALKELVAAVRETYGENVPIIWIYNSMRADHSKYTREAVEELQAEGINIAAVKFTADSSAYGHPGIDAHKKDTEQLLELLKTQYGIG